MNALTVLLDRIIDEPERHAEIIRHINDTFMQERAVMVLDMGGFTRTTQKHGIATFLLMIHQMKRLALPVVSEKYGVLVKAEADNLYCVFDTVENALETALSVFERLSHANLILPTDRALRASVGIGFGPVLVFDGDLFGDEMNLACKLGEDIADSGQILLTQAARERLGDFAGDEMAIEIAGVSFSYWSATRP